MKRYLAFCGSVYYPGGGMDDFEGDFDAVADAIAAAQSDAIKNYPEQPWRFRWAHVYDTHDFRIVWQDGVTK